MDKQLYAKLGDYKKIYPINFIRYILSDDSLSPEDTSQVPLNVLINHIYVDYKNDEENTRLEIPAVLRKNGLWITYLDYRNYYVTEFYKGESIEDDDWKDDNNWENVPDVRFVESATMRIPDEAILPNHLSSALKQLILNSGHVTNLPDDEDLEQVAGVLKFKNKVYNEYLASGKGYVILRKNWVNSKNVLTQDMVNKFDTIYEVRYDFDLQGANIRLPRNTDLYFIGGSINNGSITFENGRPIGITKFEDGGNATFKGGFTKGLIITFETDGPMWFDGTEWSKIAGSLEPSAEVRDVQETDMPQAEVTLTEEGKFIFDFGFPRGAKGEKGDKGDTGPQGLPGLDGKDGIDGVGGRSTLIFTSSNQTPDTPIGGFWDMDRNIIVPPDNWWNSTDGLVPPIWMSNGLFGSDGKLRGNWSTPIRISGENGEPGVDGVNIQFIYKLTANEEIKPDPPIGYPKDDYDAPEGWEDHPSGVTEKMRTEWMCISTKDLNTEIWGAWTEPVIWANYGISGTDGDGLKYAFKLTKDSRNPGQPTGSGEDGEFPKEPENVGWTDEPTGVDNVNKYEWVTVSKYNGKTKTWSRWSIPAVWIRYAENGENGCSVETRYTKTTGTDDVPIVVKSDRTAGSIWGLIIPRDYIAGKEAVWGIQTLIKPNNDLYQEWSDPYLITGINGRPATPVNYKTYVYKKSDTKPDKPTGTNPSPGNGWVDYPEAEGRWWQCIGDVDGATGTISSWSEVVPLNGLDGAAQDGKRTEFRFAKSTGNIAPSIYKSDRKPAGWTTQPPSIDPNLGEVLWMTNTVINGDDTLFTDWTDPVRISGEQGPKGDTGPAGSPGPTGSQGISGIPGKSIEARYCLGTQSSYNGTSNPGSNRYPSGWTTTVPTVTSSYPYIWFIQASINYSSSEDVAGEVNGAWSTPARLSGLNGINGANGRDGQDGQDGAQGRKGQVVYPAGIYSLSTSYETNKDKAPYVLDPNDGEFYVLNTEMIWLGNGNGRGLYPNQSSDWVKFESFEAIYAKIGIIANGLIGSAVFNGDFMFSQQGIIGEYKTSTSTDFELFDPSKTDINITQVTGVVNRTSDLPSASSSNGQKYVVREDSYIYTSNGSSWLKSTKYTFIPNIMFNFKTGAGHLAAGKIQFKTDGSSKIGGINIDADGNTYGDFYDKYVDTSSGYITLPTIPYGYTKTIRKLITSIKAITSLNIVCDNPSAKIYYVRGELLAVATGSVRLEPVEGGTVIVEFIGDNHGEERWHVGTNKLGAFTLSN